MKPSKILGFLLSSLLFQVVFAQNTTPQATLSVPMYKVSQSGQGDSIGTVTVTETRYGLLFTPDLHGLTPGAHGFHVHQNPSCANNADAAGGHLDPQNTGKHLGPYGDGHIGDLPTLIVNSDGSATRPVLGPRLKSLSEIQHRSLIIHAGGDNYSDKPEPLGGGGARIACGVIP